jgi:magnesium-transporting ATPase (P-type)
MVFKAVSIKDKVYTRDFIISNIDILAQDENFYDFMIGVIICHDVVRDSRKEEYQGSSPDEVCFINFANMIGFRFIGKNKKHI